MSAHTPIIPWRQARAWLLEAEIIIQLHYWQGEEAWIEIADALACAPALAVSVVYDQPQALDGVREFVERTDGRVLVGMSHVETAEETVAAAQAGANFVLTSQLRSQAWKCARELGLFYIPGVFSRTEVALARAAGLNTQFLFPADILGPDHLHQLHQAHPQVHFLPGVEFDTAFMPAYRAAGAAAMVVEMPVLAWPQWRQADVITYVRELLKAWRDPIIFSPSTSSSAGEFER